MRTLIKLTFALIFSILVFIFIFVGQPFNGKQKINSKGWKQIIPSENLPKEVECNKGNNNLDVILHNGKYYVAFRTAPSHFASKKTKLYILSTYDFEKWDFEHSFSLNKDKREPRFCSYHDTLFFYFFEAGDKFYKFEPEKVWVSFKTNNSGWSEKKDLELDHYVPWRFRVLNDTIYLSAYHGKDIYNSKHKGDLRLFKSTNGFNFTPISKDSQTPEMGGEEGEFIFDREGNLWATVRLEGDGALYVYAEKGNISKWKTKYTKHKYDSALLFEYENEIYLVSRRNLDGYASKGKNRLYNMVRYSLTKKRTAIYRLNKYNFNMEWLADFPSTGDNAFAGIAPWNDEGKFVLLNYSNDIHGKELNWIGGQLRNTNIYMTILDMKEISEKKPLGIYD